MKIDEGDWRSFERWAGDLRRSLGDNPSARLLFRGVTNCRWPLETTLERNGERGMPIAEYCRIIDTIGGSSDATDGMKSLHATADLVRAFSDSDSMLALDAFYADPHVYRYMMYLRKNKFPSPLLEWTKSPYIAAYFACREDGTDVETRSIYALCDTGLGDKGWSVDAPSIRVLEPPPEGVTAEDIRLQQIWTVCEACDSSNVWRFDSHQHVFDFGPFGEDVGWRFDLPSSECVSALRFLDDININAFSLLGSTEALLETLWTREQILASAT